MIWDVKQLKKIVKRYYFHALKALWDSQNKIKIYYGMPRDKKQLSGKRFIHCYSFLNIKLIKVWFLACVKGCGQGVGGLDLNQPSEF